MNNRRSLRDKLLFRKSLTIELDIGNLSKSLVFYNNVRIDKNKITPNYIDINYLHRDFMLNTFLYFNAKIKKDNEKVGFCVIDVKMRDGYQIYSYVVFSLILIAGITLSFMEQIYSPLFFIIFLLIINFVYMNYLCDTSTTWLIKELKEIAPRYVIKYEEEIQKRKQLRRR